MQRGLSMSEPPRAPLPFEFLPQVSSFKVMSDDIDDGELLPNAHCLNGFGLTGGNLSPHLRWEDFPEKTRSFAVTCYDPDAPTGGGFWHWMVLDIPRDVTELPTGAGSGDKVGLPNGALHVRNDLGTTEYCGAAAPDGKQHRYVFAVHALDCESLEVEPTASPGLAGFYLTSHTLARATLVPFFAR